MNITHHHAQHCFDTVIEGHTACVEYRISPGTFDIIHTRVPAPLEGRGIAAALVQTAYDYARSRQLALRGSCSYAAAWLKRRPDYLKPAS